jgi:hypothetical protein
MPGTLNDIHGIIKNLPHVPYGSDGGKIIIIDTGSPMSFGTVDTITLAGRTHPNIAPFPSNVGKYMPENVVALVGMDIIKQHDFEINLETLEVTFSDTPLDVLPNVFDLEFLMGSPTFRIGSPKGQLKCLLDTGAHLSYIARSHTESMTSTRETWDFNPFFGIFETPVFMMDVTVKDIGVHMELGNLPDVADMAIFGLTGLDAVMGLALFPGSRVVYSSSAEKISFE